MSLCVHNPTANNSQAYPARPQNDCNSLFAVLSACLKNRISLVFLCGPRFLLACHLVNFFATVLKCSLLWLKEELHIRLQFISWGPFKPRSESKCFFCNILSSSSCSVSSGLSFSPSEVTPRKRMQQFFPGNWPAASAVHIPEVHTGSELSLPTSQTKTNNANTIKPRRASR